MKNPLLSLTVDRWDGEMLHQYDLKGNYIQSFPYGPYMRMAVNYLLNERFGWIDSTIKWIRERNKILSNLQSVVCNFTNPSKSAYGYMWVRTYNRAKMKIPAYKSRTGEHLKKAKTAKKGKTKPKVKTQKNN
jgi:hypothetical protein